MYSQLDINQNQNILKNKNKSLHQPSSNKKKLNKINEAIKKKLLMK